MKHIVFVMAFILAATVVFAQVDKNQARKIKKAPTMRVDESKIPQAVKDAQAKRFPGISEVKWKMKAMRKEKQPVRFYVAVFKESGNKVNVHYKEDGTAMAVITHIPLNKIPAGTLSKVGGNYPGFTPKLAVKVDVIAKNTTVYRLTLIKPAAKLILYVDEAGNDAAKANLAQEAMGEDQSGGELIDSDDENE